MKTFPIREHSYPSAMLLAAGVVLFCVLTCAQPSHATPVTDWLAAHGCSTTIWNAGIGWPTGHGIFHPEIPCNGQDCSARYSQQGQRVNGSYAGGEWCTGAATVGDNSTLGCWAAAAGMQTGYALTSTDQQDLGYVACRGTTACAYIRATWGDAACGSGGPPPPPAPRCGDGHVDPGETCSSCPADVGACPPPPPPPAPTCAAPKVCELPVTCPTLAAVPQDVRDTIAAAPSWLPAGSGKRAALKRVQAWLALVDAYKPRVASTARLELVMNAECAP